MMKYFYLRISLILCAMLAGLPLLGQYAWNNLGPDNAGATTRALAFDAQGRLLAGAQGGGLWRSANQGDSWERVVSYDQAGGNPNVTSIAVSGSTIYVATGAANFTRPFLITRLNATALYNYQTDPAGFKGNLSGLPGAGVFVSTDGGATWSNSNATTRAPLGGETANYKGPFTNIQKVVVSGSRVFVASSEGLYYSDDNLATLTLCQGPEFLRSRIIFDVEVGANGLVVASAHEDNFTSIDSIYLSRDNGASFQAVSDPVLFGGSPNFSFARAEIALSPSDPNVFYVAGTQPSEEIIGVFRYNISQNAWSRYAPRGSASFSPLLGVGRTAFALSVFPDNAEELVVAGRSWFTFKTDRGWTQTAQHTNPRISTYLPRNMYTVLFSPSDPNLMFIGTSNGVYISRDRGATFAARNIGYESTVMYSVAASKFQVIGEEPQSVDAVMGATDDKGILYNSLHTSSLPSKQRFGRLTGANVNFGEVATSSLYPGVIVAQGSDFGLERSLNSGESFDRFYAPPISPQVRGLTFTAGVDTIIDRGSASQEGGALLNGPTAAHSAWLLDEVIPESLLNRSDLTEEEMQSASSSFLFFCSRVYVWVVSNPLGDALQVKWNRITPNLVDGATEFLTAIAVSGDTAHTLYVGSSKGNLWRITRPHDLKNFDVAVNVRQINNQPANNLFFMNGRWISALAVDPSNPDRLLVTYAGYGGDVSSTLSFLWYTDNATAPIPVFGQVISGPNLEPVYSAQFVEDPSRAEPVMLVGSESGLYSARDIFELAPNLWDATWTSEFPAEFGKIPVYDIWVRKYESEIRESALTRQEVRTRTLPDGTVVNDTIEVERNGLRISRDNTLFVATHGRGIWATNSVQRRGSPQPPLAELPEAAYTKLYPNPSAGMPRIKVELPEAAEVQLKWYSTDGRLLASESYSLAAGIHEILPSSLRLSPGLYLARVELSGEGFQHRALHKALITR